MGTRVDNLEEKIYELEEKNKKLVKALKVYANFKNWKLYFTLKNIMTMKFFFEFDNYKAYELAQKVLKEIGEQ